MLYSLEVFRSISTYSYIPLYYNFLIIAFVILPIYIDGSTPSCILLSAQTASLRQHNEASELPAAEAVVECLPPFLHQTRCGGR